MGVWVGVKACCTSQVFVYEASHAMLRIMPMSPIRL